MSKNRPPYYLDIALPIRDVVVLLTAFGSVPEIVNLVVASLVKFMRRICLRCLPPWRTLFSGIPDSNKPYGFCSNCE